MNNEQTVKAAAPILHSYFSYETTAEAALDLIGQIFKENSMNKDSATGYRVIDPEGGSHEYPNAHGVSVDRLDLYVTGENNATLAIFHRWEHVERIA